MKTRIHFFILLSLSLGLTNTALLGQLPIIHGTYGNPAPLWEKGLILSELGINAIFVGSHSIDSALMSKAKQDNLLVFSEFATLNGKNYVNDHPEAWAINEKGERVEAASWFMGVCPTNSGFVTYRMNLLKKLLQNHPVDGVWLDYLHWHAQFEELEPILPETCFCNNCLTAFQESTGLKIPDGKTSEKSHWILSQHDESWRAWRCQVIIDWVRRCRKIVEVLRPGALLGVYHCPWKNQEFGQARKRVLGLDFELLKQEVDVFSPMVYHGRMERSPDWVEDYIQWLGVELETGMDPSPQMWPIVQALDVPAMEFEKVLRAGLGGTSTGVMMFTAGSMAKDPKKIQVMKSVYTEQKQ